MVLVILEYYFRLLFTFFEVKVFVILLFFWVKNSRLKSFLYDKFAVKKYVNIMLLSKKGIAHTNFKKKKKTILVKLS